MIEVKDGKKIICFVNQVDANNYIDYMKNGLKVIRIDNRTYYFNNGDRLIDVTINGTLKKYILRSGNRTVTSEKLQRKHIWVITNQ